MLKHVNERKVGPVLARPHPVPGVRPAKPGVHQGKVAGGEHDLVVSTETQAREVPHLHLAHQVKARNRGAGQVLNVDHVERAFGKPRNGSSPCAAV